MTRFDGHTPGPWRYERYGDRWSVYSEPVDAAVPSVAVASVEPRRPGFSHPRDRADALLIAAAPELLQAGEDLAEALAPILFMLDLENNPSGGWIEGPVVDRANAALKRWAAIAAPESKKP